MSFRIEAPITDTSQLYSSLEEKLGVIISNITYPSIDGSSGQVITTDGKGSLSFSTPSSIPLPVSISNGGTNSTTALAGSSIIVSDGSHIVQGPAGTTTTVLHGNAAGIPTYSSVSLTSDITGTLPILHGGTGQTTQQSAINALAGSVTSGQYLRGNGTNVLMSAIQVGDMPSSSQLNFNMPSDGGGTWGGTSITLDFYSFGPIKCMLLHPQGPVPSSGQGRFTNTPIPSAYFPTLGFISTMAMLDNGNTVVAHVELNSDGTMFIKGPTSDGSFSGAGNVQIVWGGAFAYV
jgi:hypothetical protein